MNKALQLYLASLIIQTAVILKNTTEQYKDFPLKALGGNFAKAMFAIGWITFAMILSEKWDSRRYIALLGACLVIFAVFSFKMAKKAGKSPHPLVAMLFPIGWIVVTYALMYVKGKYNNLAILGTSMVLLSMMGLLPFQRTHNIVDGPGYPLFTLAWVLFSIVKYHQ